MADDLDPRHAAIDLELSQWRLLYTLLLERQREAERERDQDQAGLAYRNRLLDRLTTAIIEAQHAPPSNADRR